MFHQLWFNWIVNQLNWMLKVDTKRENVDLSGFGCLVLCVTSQTPPTGDGRKLRPLSFGLFISPSLSLLVWRSECFYFLRNDLNEKKNLKFLSFKRRWRHLLIGRRVFGFINWFTVQMSLFPHLIGFFLSPHFVINFLKIKNYVIDLIF